MSKSTAPNTLTVIHGGRTKEFLLFAAVILVAYIAQSIVINDTFLESILSHVAMIAVMMFLAHTSLPIVNYHVAPGRWFASGVLNIALLSAAFTVAGALIIWLLPKAFHRNPLQSYVVDQFDYGSNIALTILTLFAIHLACGFSGTAIGAAHRAAGLRGTLAALGAGFAVVLLVALIVDMVTTESISAPWPGAIIFSLPLILIGLLAAHFAARKQA